jgi:hypothetical protein
VVSGAHMVAELFVTNVMRRAAPSKSKVSLQPSGFAALCGQKTRSPQPFLRALLQVIRNCKKQQESGAKYRIA